MINKIKLLPIFLLTIILIGGCNAFDSSEAWVQHMCPIGGEDYYHLHLTQQTRELMWGHSGLTFVVKWYGFKLASKPEGRVVYSVANINFTTDSRGTRDLPQPLSGRIVVDMNTHMVYVSLKNRDGDFPGNGEYQLSTRNP